MKLRKIKWFEIRKKGITIGEIQGIKVCTIIRVGLTRKWQVILTVLPNNLQEFPSVAEAKDYAIERHRHYMNRMVYSRERLE